MEQELARKVLIALPSRGMIHKATTVWLTVQAQKGYRVLFGDGPLSVEDARTQLVSKFLAQPEFTHLMFVDDDVVPPFNVVEDLYKMDKDIAAGNYPLYIDKRIISAAFTRDKDVYTPHSIEEDGVKEVDAIGLGCALIKKEVLQKCVAHACFAMRYGMKDGRFQMLDTDDTTFCKYAKFYGFRIFVDFDQICDHYKSCSLLGVVEDHERGDLVYNAKS